MLPLLATHAAHAPCRIAWFMGTVLPAIRECETAAAAAHAAGRERNARVLVGRASQLWRLLPVVLRAPSDVVAGAFDANLGRILSSLLANAARPDLAELAGRGLAALIAGLRAAAGLPPVGLERLTGVAGQEDGDDEAGDGGRSVAGEGGGGGGGGATVLGAGGVSVYGGSVSPSDPRHHWLAQAIKAPPLSDGKPRGADGDDAGAAAARVAAATAGLAAVASLARNYLPVLFNAYEVRRGGGRGRGRGARRAVPTQPPAVLARADGSGRRESPHCAARCGWPGRLCRAPAASDGRRPPQPRPPRPRGDSAVPVHRAPGVFALAGRPPRLYARGRPGDAGGGAGGLAQAGPQAPCCTLALLRVPAEMRPPLLLLLILPSHRSARWMQPKPRRRQPPPQAPLLLP